jgi:hypothetical protein
MTNCRSVALGMTVVCAMTLQAQQPGCGTDSTARWARRQREWLDESRATWANDSLRRALLDPASDTDSALRASLVALGRQRGATWPTRSVVGAQGVRAVARLAMSDTALLRVALRRMMEAGPEESFPPDVALLEDRLRTRTGRKQLYGIFGAFPIEDSAHVDMRRDGAMLPPLRACGQ